MGLFDTQEEKEKKRKEKAQALLLKSAETGDQEKFDEAIAQGGDIHDPAVIRMALGKGHNALLKRIFDGGVSLEKDLGKGETPLLYVAACCYRSDTITYLIERGADVYAVNAEGDTPLKKALADNMLDYYYQNGEAFLKKGVLLDRSGVDAADVLPKVIKEDRWSLVNELAKQMDPKDMGPALFQVVKQGKWDFAKEWIQKGVPLDAVDSDSGWSLLHYVAHNGRGDLVKLLLDKGIDPNIQDNFMKLASDVAQRDYPEIARFIRQFSGKETPAAEAEVPSTAAESFPAIEKWCISMPGEVAHVIEKTALDYRITETFNFHTRVYTQIARNLETNVESQVMRMFDEFNDRAVLERALTKANELGEKIDSSALSPMMQKVATPALPAVTKSG